MRTRLSRLARASGLLAAVLASVSASDVMADGMSLPADASFVAPASSVPTLLRIGRIRSRGVMEVANRPDCTPTANPTGKEQCYHNGSACYAFVMVCYSCCYDGNGRSKGESGSPCGICVGWDF